MAANDERILIGRANRGTEHIYPGKIKDWDYREKFNDLSKSIPFTDIHHDTSLRVKGLIQTSGGFKGGDKKYEEDMGRDITGSFSWWSVNIAEADLQRIINDNNLAGKETADVFEPRKSRYGQQRFVIGLNTMIRAYATRCASPAEIRILGTFKYKREVMHALVIAPQRDKIFQTKPLLARFTNPEDQTDGEGEIFLEANPILTYSGEGQYNWTNFSTITWDNQAQALSDKIRFWGNLAFAFFLNPLEEQLLLLDVRNLANWQRVEKGSKWLGENDDNVYNDMGSLENDDQSEADNETGST